MEKRTIVAIAVLPWIFLALLSGARAQDTFPSKVLSGTVAAIDWQKQELAVQNKYGAVLFRWDNQTQFHPENFRRRLEEGTPVFVYFSEGGGNLIASRIELNWVGFGLKGLQYPFDCGLKVC